ncbi:MAG: iron-sulfur cluster repair di-iron protein [Vicinamibacterales bacterium]
MTITPQTTVADIASAVPSSVRVFGRHNIDFCCGGRRPLATVCEEQGLSFDAVAREIEAGAQGPVDQRDWRQAPLADIIDFIVATYHNPLREELPRLETMAAKVLKVHGAKDESTLSRIDAIVRELSADLIQHMWKEEQVLFPVIRAGEAGTAPMMPIGQPIAVMEHEHDRAGELLAELSRITAGYAVPGWACATARALYQGLAEFESTMHLHVHLENNVLFPRALKQPVAA